MKKLGFIALVCAVIAAIGIPELQFQREKSRRRHQIGQLWSLIRLYYVPAHEGRYPTELQALEKLPQYVSFFDRAIREIELVTPGIPQDANPNAVVLRERFRDRRGYLWVHLLDGAIEYRKESIGMIPSPQTTTVAPVGDYLTPLEKSRLRPDE